LIELYVRLFRMENDKIIGLALFVAEPGQNRRGGQAVFVNIAGKVDLVKIAQISHRFGVPRLDEVLQNI